MNENGLNNDAEEIPAEDVMGIVNILDSEDPSDSEMLAQFSQNSAVIKEPDGTEYITLKAAEAYTGYSNQTLRQYYKKGKIKGIKKPSAFGDTIYLNLDDVKTFRAAVNTKKAAKMDSAEFAMEVSSLLTSTTSEALLPVMEKISGIEMNQIEILDRLAAVDELSEKVSRISAMLEELKAASAGETAGETAAESDEPAALTEKTEPCQESSQEENGAGSEEETPESTEQTAEEPLESSREVPPAEKEENEAPEKEVLRQMQQMMNDYNEMKDIIRNQQEYIERQKKRTLFQRIFNKEG